MLIAAAHLSVAVLGLDEVGKSLGLLKLLLVVVVMVVLGTDILHLVHASALRAALDGAVAGHLSTIISNQPFSRNVDVVVDVVGTHAEPGSGVGVSWDTSAASKLLITGGAEGDGVLHSAQTAGVEGTHVEDVDALHLTQDLETLQTGSLLEIGGDGAGLGARTEEVLLALDLCCSNSD